MEEIVSDVASFTIFKAHLRTPEEKKEEQNVRIKLI